MASLETDPPTSITTMKEETVVVDADSQKEELSKAIRYRLQYRNETGDIVREKSGYKPWPQLDSEEEDEAPVLEIITYVTSRIVPKETTLVSTPEAATAAGVGEEKSNGGETKSNQASTAATKKDSDDEKFKIESVGSTEMKIHSVPLLKKLRSKVEYYPGQSLTGSTITVPEPYHMLLHFQKDLSSFQQPECSTQCDKNGLTNGQDDDVKTDELTHQHIEVLNAFLDAKFKRKIDDEMMRHQMNPPVATFEMLWMLLKPGTFVCTEIDGAPAGCVVKAVQPLNQMGLDTGESPPATFRVTLWNLDFNGRTVGRREKVMHVKTFDGERVITSLMMYPLSYAPAGLQQTLIYRGKRCWDILKSGSMQMDYDGDYRGSDKKKRFCKGRVILAPASFWEYNDKAGDPPQIGVIDDDGSGTCTCEACEMRREAMAKPGKWATFDNIDPAKKDTIITDEHLLLLPKEVQGFILKTRQWATFNINFASDCQLNEKAIDALRMNPKRRNMIVALSHKYIASDNGKEAWTADFIQNKGEGQIFLFHGPPGVGKTFTAECIAELTKRPLLSLTCADIGIDEETMETQLWKWFTLAEQWGAIMLIDEADVYLEIRVRGELQRNSLVSAFLRSMEYYRGILFLTTNRIGHIDDAIMSRVHIVIEYEELQQEDRESIWDQFFQKLTKDRPSFIVDAYAEDYVKSDPKVVNLRWNGREIRNAFQTAVALAEYEARAHPEKPTKLKKQNFADVVEVSQAFRDYMRKLKSADEAARAYKDGARADHEFPDNRKKLEERQRLKMMSNGIQQIHI